MSALEQQHQARINGLAGITVYADERPDPCSHCGGPMRVQKTVRRKGVTLAHGQFVVNETVYFCASQCGVNGSHLVKRQPALADILPPRGTVGYDVMVFVGRQRFLFKRQRGEIITALREQFGIHVSSGEISHLMRDFLLYLATVHRRRAPELRKVIEREGGYVLHNDATCETGRGTLFTCYASTAKRRWVLGAWKIGTERADLMIPRVEEVEALFGAPLGMMRDLGKAAAETAMTVVGEREIRIFACHLHFLKDVGKDLLQSSHDNMRGLVRRFKINAKLKAFIRSLGRKIGSEIEVAREEVDHWVRAKRPIPQEEAGLALVRAFAQWVVDYHAIEKNAGFPFDNPYLEFYRRAHQMLRAIESLLRSRPHKQVNKALMTLHGILLPVRSEVPFAQVARTLQSRGTLFDRLRKALRLHEKGSGKEQAANGAPRTPAQQIAELLDIEAEVIKLKSALRRERPERGPGQDLREAIDIVLEHLDRHGPNLWGHLFKLPSGEVFIADRTNVALEQFFHLFKHGERRRSGRKNLTQDIEDIPAEALLATNLQDPHYLNILCEGKDLATAFAQLDADDRSRSLPTRTALHQSAQEAEIASASLPKPDKQLVRREAMQRRIYEEATRRAPKLEGIARGRRAQP